MLLRALEAGAAQNLPPEYSTCLYPSSSGVPLPLPFIQLSGLLSWEAEARAPASANVALRMLRLRKSR